MGAIKIENTSERTKNHIAPRLYVTILEVFLEMFIDTAFYIFYNDEPK